MYYAICVTHSADILAGQNVILFFPRRYGKTSLILETLDRLRTQGVLTVYLDLFRVTSEEEFVAAYARGIAGLCGGGMRAVLRKLRALLPRFIPRVSLKGEGFEVEFTFDLRAGAGSAVGRPLRGGGHHRPGKETPGGGGVR